MIIIKQLFNIFMIMNPKKQHKNKQSGDPYSPISRLIRQLIGTAKSRGITQAQLAKSAGLTAVGLSKAKTRGDLRASSLARLAEQLDLELVLAPSQRQDKIAEAIKSGHYFNKTSKPVSEES